MPFKALLNGKPFYSEELYEEVRKQDYKCPFCEKEFIPVIPKSERIKHFRHKKGDKAHGEPDGPEHRAIKKAVKEGAEALAFKTDYEVILRGDEIRITDVLIETDCISSTLMEYRGFAVECQCAQMSLEEFNERNQAYKKFDLKPLWILGSKYFNSGRVKKLVEQNIAEFQFCCFFVDNHFFINNGENIQETTLRDIILLRSGYSKRDNPLAYRSKLVKQGLIIQDLNERLSKLSDYTAQNRISELENDLSQMRSTITELEREISNYTSLIDEKTLEISKLSEEVLATRNSELELILARRKKTNDRLNNTIRLNREKLTLQALLIARAPQQ